VLFVFYLVTEPLRENESEEARNDESSGNGDLLDAVEGDIGVYEEERRRSRR
jgi:hypothetical protein